MSHDHSAIYAAGAVCWRVVDGKVMVLLVHRTAYGDVTIPKGKVDPGESLPQTAVREIKEETGLSVWLGVPLGAAQYRVHSGREKIVHYWAAEVTEAAVLASTFVPNAEIAALEWVSVKRALAYASYDQDVEILRHFAKLLDEGVTSTFPIIVLRHAKATAHSEWSGSDASRPLTARGVSQAASIVPSLLAWGPRRIVSSSATRCITTVAPLAAALGRKARVTDDLSQNAYEAGEADVRAVIGKRIASGKPAVLCSHGPLLPLILREIALATATPAGSYLSSAADLDPAAFSVVHVSATAPASGIISIETHEPRV
ncbi:NUDIX hydrolase [Labedella populi]|uniref:NUDIX hydrolase n=1 Tax=Labedella populi TaxID=2498850 RepID=A0A444QD09_9MICO|nr:NUDIX domain-containing protein [Labedella populi]RWZ64476.1 NUDIX hydrolase [Labedella populi]